MNYVVDSAEFEDDWNTMLFTVSVNSTVLLLSALYVVLFLFSIHTLQRRIPGGKFLLGTAWIMFVLASAGIIIVISTTAMSMRMVYLLVQGYTDRPARLLRLYHSLALGQDIVLAVNNLVTDLLFLYRCYVIWGSRRRVLVVPAAMILATVVVGCISGLTYYGIVKWGFTIDTRVPFIMGGATNILLMCLTAGRIWYLRREIRALTGQSLRKRYDTAVAIVLESGILYCVCVIIYVIAISTNQTTVFGTIFKGVAWGLVQLGVNIVPTLILVRVGMGRSTENRTTELSFGSHTTDIPMLVSKDGQPLGGHMERDGWRTGDGDF
ncbi:hypothetical protein MVEN_00277000 [Mycena venus]|uniref:Uncharacterized protein n=1 Tax=Mycena venus TaxID=2733690 RepID=A0A8H6YZP4_9AGAR|nr:hypothetical protein MVEN_00277000 [Mycena venus]